MGGGKKATVGYWYSFSILMGISRGPINVLRQVEVGDRDAWTGDQGDGQAIEINHPGLFGGEEKEGGIVGTLTTFFGAASQVFSSSFKGLMGGRVSDMRGIATFTFRGKIAANNPYPKPWRFRVARWDEGWDTDESGDPYRSAPWYPAKARIMLSDGRGGFIYAMNPAHILYECYTNRVWGRGHHPSELLEDAFVSAANTLCDEAFGLCLKWTRQGDIDEFIKMVHQHIGSAEFRDAETGKVGIRLVRADYDPNDLVVFGYDTGLLEIEEDETGGGDSAFSEIVVKYVDARTGEDATERAQSLAIMQSLGDIASTTVSYEGVPTASLALRLAARDLDQQATFLKRFKVVLDRRGWQLSPGHVFKVNASDYGLAEVILRVGSIVDSELKDGRITVTAIQDVFGLPATGYTEPTLPGAWTPPDNTALAVTTARVEEVTYRDLVRSLSPTELAAVDATETRIAIFAEAPSGTAINYDIASAATGETLAVNGSGDWTLGGLLAADVGHYDDTITLDSSADLSTVAAGETILIDDEIMGVLAVGSGELTVSRGVLDTIPTPHAADAKVWFVEDSYGTDDRNYTTGEDVAVRLLTRTSSAVLDIGAAPEETKTLAGRQSAPYPPGDVQVNAVPFGTFEADLEVASGEVDLTWTHRDRVLQADQLLEHEAGSVGPEAGTTYEIDVYDGVTLLRSVTGETGTAWTYDSSMISADGEPTEEAWTFHLRSRRDGLASLQEYVMLIRRRLSQDVVVGATGTVVIPGYAPEVTSDWNVTPGVQAVEIVGYPPNISL